MASRSARPRNPRCAPSASRHSQLVQHLQHPVQVPRRQRGREAALVVVVVLLPLPRVRFHCAGARHPEVLPVRRRVIDREREKGEKICAQGSRGYAEFS
ncbi:hypothetical protein PAHAL_4G279900 [Panicum hallii]|uniref:Uncharacterized protein n=1 Tax=Panicum hallii TaxID=206008 RepID=A0A2T8JE89_9POAL|nr:hypothetical protein PAHAL_4G279900 [Panicum hallii]